MDYRAYADHLAKKYGLKYFVPQINQESHFDPNARSGAGAIGIAQIMPQTAAGWHVDPTNPKAALEAAARNMARYRDQYGNERDALIAYNAGPGRVGKSLPAETQKYLQIIMGGKGNQGSTQAPDATRASFDATSLGSIPGASQDVPKQPSVYDVIAQYREATQPKTPTLPLGQQNPTQPGGYSLTPYDPVESGKQIQATVQKIQQIKQGFQAGDATAAGLAPNDPHAPAGLRQILETADDLDAKNNAGKLPYVWGGGHGGSAGGLDCSGAISRLLGIDPRVAKDFMSWGEGGHGEHVTIYANAGHVLAEVDGKFFGTSRSNPQGGAGWIDRAAIPASYLKNFTVRHPKGM